MSLIAPIVDGKLQSTSVSSKSLSSASEKDTSQIDSEAFLTLLVAEMQNQDPLEPTSNTEWISQYATFTQVSEVQAIGDSMNAMKADSLVGKTVIMSVTDESGNTDEVTGVVDLVSYEEGKAFLSIDGAMYSIDDLKTVISDRYVEAADRADALIASIKKLPSPSMLSSDYVDAVKAVIDEFDDMNDFEKSFLDDSISEGIDLYRVAVKAYEEAAEAAEEEEAEEETVESTVAAATTATTETTATAESAASEESEEEAADNINATESVDSTDTTEAAETAAETSESDSTETQDDSEETGDNVSGS